MKDRKKYPLNILNDDKLVIDSKFKNKLKVKLFEYDIFKCPTGTVNEPLVA